MIDCNGPSLTYYVVWKFTNTLSLHPIVIYSGYFYSLDQHDARMYYITLSLDFTCFQNLVLYPHSMCC